MKKEISGSSATSLLVCSCFILGFTLIPLALTIAVAGFGAHFFTLLLIGYICGFFFLVDCLYLLLRPEKEEAWLLAAAMLSCIAIQFPYVSYDWFGTDIDIVTAFCILSVLLIATHAAFFAVLIRNLYRKLAPTNA